MKIHLIFDFSHIYYKYLFRVRNNKISKLTAEIFEQGDDFGTERQVTKDVSLIYYPIREIENMRRALEENSKIDLTISVCFDMPSKRKESSKEEGDAASQYKANRKKTLCEEDFENIREIQRLLDVAGYNTYREEGFEADDLVVHLVKKHHDEFDYNMIYTNDADLLALIDEKVAMYKYKTTGEYKQIHRGNFETMAQEEFKCSVPFNAVMLYKATTGDASDNIKGIPKFGKKAFEKLVNYLNSQQATDWSTGLTYEGTKAILDQAKGYLYPTDVMTAMECLELVRPLDLGQIELGIPSKKTSKELRQEAYLKYNMQSLVN